MKKSVIVTGGAGYIGSHTIIELLEKTDYNIISIDNFSNSSESCYQRIETITKKSFSKLNIDLCDFREIKFCSSFLRKYYWCYSFRRI